MGTRSKKISKLFPLSVRITAFVLACLFTGLAVFGSMSASTLDMEIESKYGAINESYESWEEYRSKLRDTYEQLCILGVCELANSGSSGYIGNKNIQSDLLFYFDYNQYSYRKTDDGIKPASEMFDYYVSYTFPEDKSDDTTTDEETTAAEDSQAQNRTLFVTNISSDIVNSDMTEEERIKSLTSKRHSYIMRSHDVISSDMLSSGSMITYRYQTPDEDSGLKDVSELYPNNYLPSGGWYHDNYGRYVYYFGNDEPIKFYEYSEDSEEGIKARREYVDTEVSYLPEGDAGYSIESDDGQTHYFITQPIFSLRNYKATKGDTEGLTVFIVPREGLFRDLSKSYNESMETLAFIKSITIKFTCISAVLILYLLVGAAVFGLACIPENSVVRRIPFEVYILIGIIMLASYRLPYQYYLFNYYSEFYSEFGSDEVVWRYLGLGVTLVVAAGIMIHTLCHTLRLVFSRKLKESFKLPGVVKKLSEEYYASHLYEQRRNRAAGSGLLIRSLINETAFFVSVIALYVAINTMGEVAVIMMAVCILSAGFFLYSQIKAVLLARDLSKLDRQITALNSSEPFDEKFSRASEVKRLADMMNNISESVRHTVEEQIKSERMKIELVANVSHDLKTPLTSIISYIDLLKKTELDDEAMGYVQILDKKSQKLKGIVADVFSLAKATSGIDVNMEELDFVRLFNQSLADAEDKIKESRKTFKINVTEETAPVMGDGNKLYRVLQNIIDNALKYSMDGSRIFLELTRDGENIVFTAKNISSYPIDFTADEITERFVRGDKSRTDGGSGLGLSIAKSFTEACGGRFEIELDGDMFKAIMSMPLINKEEPEEEKETI